LTDFCAFCHLLEPHELTPRRLRERSRPCLEDAALFSAPAETIVDATLIAAAGFTKNASASPANPESGSKIRKAATWHFRN